MGIFLKPHPSGLSSDVIVDRYQRFTGKQVVLERTGESPIPMKLREENLGDLVYMNLHHVAELQKDNFIHLLGQPTKIISKLCIDFLEARVDFFLACFVSTWGHKKLVAVGANFEWRIRRDLKHVQDWLIYYESEAITMLD